MAWRRATVWCVGLAGILLASLLLSAPSPVTARPNGPAAGPSAARAASERPRIRFDPIPYDRARRRQMAAYSERHYGEHSWRLTEDQTRGVVLHYTAGPSYESAWNTFASNAPALGEKPGVCAQFIVDKDGKIYQLTRLEYRCRHAIGVNHRTIGIEMVQESLGNPTVTAEAILARGQQSRAATRLVAWLKRRYGIRMRNVIGHAMANESELFEDRRGWRNDHADWLEPEVKTFRHRVRRLLRS